MFNDDHTAQYELDKPEVGDYNPNSLSEEKKREAMSAAVIEQVFCEECGELTHLIGVPGHNSTSDCENCGETYKVVG